jgi:ABC-type transport system involved in multi-copper enzyme maturation permease subunit
MSAQRLLSSLRLKPWVARPYRAAAVAGLIVLAAAALGLGNRLALVPQLLLWATLVLAAAVTLRDLPERLFGPVLFYDLVQTSRRGRYLVLRFGYALILLALLAFSYHSALGFFSSELPGGYLFRSSRQLTTFANDFFVTFVAVQFLAVVIFTPLFTASVVTEERERKTLDYLLSTDLGDHEIILSKLIARLTYTVVLLLAGLPVLALIQFLGGVDPNRVLASFAATAATMGSLGALGVLVSVHNRTTWDAVFRTYLIATVCLVVTLVLSAVLSALWPRTLAWANLGNPVIALVQLEQATRTTAPKASSLGDILLAYCSYHLAAMVLFAWLAIAHFRSAALATKKALLPKELDGSAIEPDSVAGTGRRRLPMTDDPLIWKEVNEKPVSWLATASTGSVGLMTAGALSYLFLLFQVAGGEDSANYAALLGAIGAGWYLFMLLLVALSAAGRFSGEIERQTLDSLLLVPARAGIPYAKWGASIVHLRPGWCLLAWLMCFGPARGLSLECVILSVAAWWVYAAFASSVGLWCSLLTRSTTRATLLTVLLILAIVVAAGWIGDHAYQHFWPRHPWLGGFLYVPPEFHGLEDFGMAGPITLWSKAVERPKGGWLLDLDRELYESGNWLKIFLTFLPGLAFYAFLAWLFWRMAWARFELLTGETSLWRQPLEIERVVVEVDGRAYEL